MSEDRVYYRKAKRVYMVLNASKVTVIPFSNIKACVGWCNGRPSMALVEDLKYQTVVSVLSKGHLFEFDLTRTEAGLLDLQTGT